MQAHFLKSLGHKDPRGDAEKDTENINMVQYLPVSETTQDIICKAPDVNPVMKDLKTVIREGWPEKRDHIPLAVQD